MLNPISWEIWPGGGQIFEGGIFSMTPAQNATLTTNSNYIFQMSSHNNNVHAFQPVDETGKAIEFMQGRPGNATTATLAAISWFISGII